MATLKTERITLIVHANRVGFTCISPDGVEQVHRCADIGKFAHSFTCPVVVEVRTDNDALIGRIYVEPNGHVWTADVWLLDKTQAEIARYSRTAHLIKQAS